MATAAKKIAAPEPEVAGMKCTLNRGEFLRALSYASAIVERRNTIPVLSNVLLEATSDGLCVTATDLNLQIALSVPAQVEAEGATTVSAQLLTGIIREFADGAQVELSLDDNRLQVISGRSRYKLQTIPRDDFPVVQAKDALASFALPAKELLAAFRRVEFAQATDHIVKSHLCGISIDVVDDELTFAATDGNRLAWSTLPAPDVSALNGVILSSKLVSSLSRLLDGRDGDVRLTFEERRVVAEIDSAILSGKLVEGTFPPWRRIIPKASGQHVDVSIPALEGALRRAALIASDRTSLVKIELSPDKLTVSATSPERGTAVEEVPCALEGDDISFGVNSRFLLDMLGAAGDGDIHVAFSDAASPMLFSNPADDSARWIVPPMRV